MPAGNDATTRNVITPRLGLITPRLGLITPRLGLITPRLGSSRRVLHWWRSDWGWPLGFELVLAYGVLLFYRWVRSLARGNVAQAMENAERVVAFERTLRVFNEQGLQRLVLESQPAVSLLNRYYVAVHLSLTATLLVWAYVRHRWAYCWVRNWYLLVTLAALAIHLAFPLAPPRMLGHLGFVDTLQRHGPQVYSADVGASMANQFAAMPSLHFGWSVMAAIVVVALHPRGISTILFLHPLITLVAIVATANHYWVDAVVALALVVLVGFGLQHLGSGRLGLGGGQHELGEAEGQGPAGQQAAFKTGEGAEQSAHERPAGDILIGVGGEPP